VGSKAFALGWKGRAVLKLDRDHQELLFEARPDAFEPFRFGPNRWAYVELARLEETEVAELVREAWAGIVPKRVSRPYFEALDRRGVS
jgi:hypothetical protein